jgi:2-methylisocitrate lyase-like PEP mutase family enzyme
LRRVAETFKGATLLANMVEGGRTPYLSAHELAALGFKIALYPGSGFLTAAGALQLVYRRLKSDGIGTGSEAPLLPFADMNRLMGFPAVHAFEQRYGLTHPRTDK